MKSLFLLILPVLGLAACSYNLDIERNKTFVPKVVVNSLLSADEAIEVRVGWSKRIEDATNDALPIDAPSGVAELFEDGASVATSEIPSDGVIKFNHTAKAGSAYRLELEVDEYGAVSAETTIPRSTEVNASVTERVHFTDQYGSKGYFFDIPTGIAIEVNNIALPEELRSVWLSLSSVYSYTADSLNSTVADVIQPTNFYNLLYCNHPHIDNISRRYEHNFEGGFDFMTYLTSDPIFDSFARLAYADIAKVSSFSIGAEFLAFMGLGFDIDGESIYSVEPISKVQLRVTSPSDEYDRHFRTRYEQYGNTATEGQVFFETVRVFTNVQGGLGIFAGYNATTVELAVSHL